MPLAAQIFQLWNERILRATSVNFLPKTWTYRPGTGPDDPKEGRQGMHVTEWELLEWGPVGIPDNPYAVGKVLDIGRLDGRAIEEPLLRMLKRFAPQRRAYTTGIDAMPAAQKTVGQDGNARSDEEVKAKKDGDSDDNGGEEGGMSASHKAADAPAGAPPKAPTPQDGRPDPDDDDDDGANDSGFVPQGSRALAAVHKMLLNGSRKCLKSAEKIEHPKVNEFLKDLGNTLNGHVAETEKMHFDSYKDLPRLISDEEEGDSDDDGDDDSGGGEMHKFFAEGQAHRTSLRGLALTCRVLSSAKNLNAHQRATLDGLGEGIVRLLDKANRKSSAAVQADKNCMVPVLDPSVTKALNEFAADLREVHKTITDAKPFRRPA